MFRKKPPGAKPSPGRYVRVGYNKRDYLKNICVCLCGAMPCVIVMADTQVQNAAQCSYVVAAEPSNTLRKISEVAIQSNHYIHILKQIHVPLSA